MHTKYITTDLRIPRLPKKTHNKVLFEFLQKIKISHPICNTCVLLAQFQVKKISKFHKFILRSKHIDYVEMVLLEVALSRFKTSP